jgi:hypothetical protein
MTQKIQDYLIATSYDFDGRDIWVKVTHDGYSHWTDKTPQHELEKKQPGYTLLSYVFRGKPARVLADLEAKHTHRALIPDDDLHIIRNELSPAYWESEDIPNYPPEFSERLDKILEPIFWEQINPLLLPPCTPPGFAV